MFTVIATLAVRTGGDAVMSDIEKRFPFDDDCIICPFHGWRFDGAGSNVEIPYAKTVNRTEFRAWARRSYEEAFA